MDALNATISRVSKATAEILPKNASEWAVSAAAATAALIVGLNLVWANKDKNSPPMVSSWIPWIGSQWALDNDPDAFMRAAQLSAIQATCLGGGFIRADGGPRARVVNAAIGSLVATGKGFLFWDDWKGFDDGVYKVALAYPVRLCPHFVKCREKVIQRFLEYLDDPAHEPCDMIAEMETMARDAKLDRRDLGVMIMACYWPLMANVPWGSFWLLALQMQHSEGLAPILAEHDAAGEAWASTQPDPMVSYLSNLTAFFQSQPQLPLFQSTINEVLRFTSDSYSMRGVVPDEGPILGGYKFKKNDTLIMSIRSVHFDEALFGGDAKEFNPRRWPGSLSEEAKGSFRPYGGGVSRHFAS
ncbi:hypothetical protein FS837_012146 [Tulasnella sp. UAMH 9824]|nr:hypothetical protein FS837_012146 [Tulasnella sp. UAMH 9824]